MTEKEINLLAEKFLSFGHKNDINAVHQLARITAQSNHDDTVVTELCTLFAKCADGKTVIRIANEVLERP